MRALQRAFPRRRRSRSGKRRFQAQGNLRPGKPTNDRWDFRGPLRKRRQRPDFPLRGKVRVDKNIRQGSRSARQLLSLHELFQRLLHAQRPQPEHPGTSHDGDSRKPRNGTASQGAYRSKPRPRPHTGISRTDYLRLPSVLRISPDAKRPDLSGRSRRSNPKSSRQRTRKSCHVRKDFPARRKESFRKVFQGAILPQALEPKRHFRRKCHV